MAHERCAFGAARLDVAVVELRAEQEEAAEPLLAAAVESAANAALPFLKLYGASAAYRQFGLVPCRLLQRIALPSARERTVLRPVDWEDLDDLAALAAATNAGHRLSPLRTAPDWRWELGRPQGWLGLEDRRGRLVAYARLAEGVVSEAGAADAGAARGLVTALGGQGATVLALPPAHPVAQAALLLGNVGTLAAATANQEVELWGVVELVAALEALAAELMRRLAGSRYSGWTGAVRLEGEAGAATLRCGEGRLSVDAESGPVDVMIGGLGLGAAAQLILGYRPAADLRAMDELRCADVDLGLLDVLFPAPVLSGA